jgi:hypothetical protein
MDDRAPAGREADTIWQATIGAALARRGQPLQTTGAIIGAAAIVFAIFLLMIKPERAGATLVLSIAQLGLIGFGLYLGQRVALDADLFAALARHPDPAGFDAAMVDLGLIEPSGVGRSMHDRVKGLKRLLSWLIGAIALQMALFALVLFGGLA